LGETLASAAVRGTPYRMVCDREHGSVMMLAFANFSHALVAEMAASPMVGGVTPCAPLGDGSVLGEVRGAHGTARPTSTGFAEAQCEIRFNRDGLRGFPLGERRVDYSQVRFTSQAELRATLGARLAQISNFVEREFGAPQDVEGVIRGDEIILVQSRAQQGIPPTT
jgi:hypothetical protein